MWAPVAFEALRVSERRDVERSEHLVGLRDDLQEGRLQLLTNVGRVPTGRSAAMGCCVGFTTGAALHEGAVPVRQVESIPEPRG